jgi:hypothetical protein
MAKDVDKKRNQINFACDDALREALDDIRSLTRPVPSLSEAIRDAIFEKRDRLRRKAAERVEYRNGSVGIVSSVAAE